MAGELVNMSQQRRSRVGRAQTTKRPRKGALARPDPIAAFPREATEGLDHSAGVDRLLGEIDSGFCRRRIRGCCDRSVFHLRDVNPNISAIDALDPRPPPHRLTLKCLNQILFVIHEYALNQRSARTLLTAV
jgi:hypothetical protein